MPGAGKTVLSSIIVEQLLSEYHGSRYKQEQTSDEFLRNILKQLLQRSFIEQIPEGISEFYDAHRSGHPSFEVLAALLKGMLAPYARVSIVIDALDENEPSTSNLDSCMVCKG